MFVRYCKICEKSAGNHTEDDWEKCMKMSEMTYVKKED